MKKTAIFIGIAGALGMAICDMILLAQPVSGSYYDLSSFGAMEHISSSRAVLGSTLGLVCAFFICFGFWYLLQLFNRVSESVAILLFISLCSVEFFGGAFHAGYYFLSDQRLIPNTLTADFTQHLEWLSYLGVPGYIAGTILFFRLALDSRFPKWFRFANPLIIHGILLLAFTPLPAPIGGYMKPTFINIGFAIWFGISVWVGQLQPPLQTPKKY